MWGQYLEMLSSQSITPVTIAGNNLAKRRINPNAQLQKKESLPEELLEIPREKACAANAYRCD